MDSLAAFLWHPQPLAQLASFWRPRCPHVWPVAGSGVGKLWGLGHVIPAPHPRPFLREPDADSWVLQGTFSGPGLAGLIFDALHTSWSHLCTEFLSFSYSLNNCEISNSFST